MLVTQGKNLIIRVLLTFFLAASLCTLKATHIQSFHSELLVETSGTLQVTNTIKYTETQEGKHGIRHSIPIAYTGPLGTNYTTKLTIKKITRDNQPVPFEQTIHNGRITFLIGSANTTIPAGTYTYVIEYTTQRQLQFYEEYDELAWNVTGLESAIPIYHARATIKLPNDIPSQSITASAFTGPYKSTQRHASIESKNHTISISTTRPLRPFEGLTIYVSWAKGYVKRPSATTELWLFSQDNPGLLLFFLLLIIVIYYLVTTIKRIHAYEKPSTIIPRFYPPKDATPAECGFLKQRYTSPTHVAAEIVDLAIRGYLTIEAIPPTKKADTYLLKKTSKPWNSELNLLEKALLASLFDTNEEYRLHKNPNEKERKKAGSLIKSLQKSIASRPFKNLLTLHISFILPVLCAIIGAVAICSALDGYVSALTLIPASVLIAIATWYLPGYTPEGRRAKDELEGFALYLKTAEIDRLQVIGTPPIKTPELFEKYLPFAMALGLEEQWTQQFGPLFKEWEDAQHPYQPRWFIGNHFSPLFISRFTRLYAATTHPSPTYSPSKMPTGRFGGGFSGGGRGGGGTGSW